MKLTEFYNLKQKVVNVGYGGEIAWQESASCDCADEFLWNYIWVVISSGIKNQVARVIEQRIVEAYNTGTPIENAFGHKGKVKAIKEMIAKHEDIYEDYLESPDKVGFLESLPYIGKITKYHLAKNLGEDVVKPDRHLVRIAKRYDMSPLELCEKLSQETGLRVATIDIILWRGANLGLI